MRTCHAGQPQKRSLFRRTTEADRLRREGGEEGVEDGDQITSKEAELTEVKWTSEATGNKKVDWRSPILRARAADGALFRNESLSFAADIMRSEAARVDAQLVEDYLAVMRGNTVYMHNFVCTENDFTLYNKIKEELVAYSGEDMTTTGGLIDWSKHQVFENPKEISPTFNVIIDMLTEFFDLDVYATRLNYYRDGKHWKPQHHDSHAYGESKGMREDFTAGLTLGATRSLTFVHVASGRQFEFPQLNGDCFAFTAAVNKTFTHGVPKVLDKPIGDRLSIIAWGRRKSLNERNGGGLSTIAIKTGDGRDVETLGDAVSAAQALVSVSRRVHTTAHSAYGATSSPAQPPQQHAADEGNGASETTKTTTQQAPPAKKKKNRLQ